MNYKLEKLFAWIKWGATIILNDGILKLLAAFLYPLVIYPTRQLIRYFWYDCGKIGKILSFLGFIFLNDPEDNEIDHETRNYWIDDYGTPEYRKSIGFDKPLEEYNWLQLWWISCRWSGWRNNNFNAHRFFCPKYNDHSEYTDYDCIEAKNINHDFSPSGLDYCVLKYKFEDGTEADNFGTQIDYEASILGKLFCYYRVNGALYFRYSKAWVKGNLAHELQLGTNGRRFKIRIKWKKLKK